MTELYACGTSRIAYKAQSFAAGIIVTAHFWNPSLTKSSLQTFTEIELGLYYLDYDFAQEGTYIALFYEGGEKKTMGTFRITELSGLIHDEVIEGTITSRQLQRILLAALAGKSVGGGTSTSIFRDNGDTKDRISATVDGHGNRTHITLDGT